MLIIAMILSFLTIFRNFDRQKIITRGEKSETMEYVQEKSLFVSPLFGLQEKFFINEILKLKVGIFQR